MFIAFKMQFIWLLIGVANAYYSILPPCPYVDGFVAELAFQGGINHNDPGNPWQTIYCPPAPDPLQVIFDVSFDNSVVDVGCCKNGIFFLSPSTISTTRMRSRGPIDTITNATEWSWDFVTMIQRTTTGWVYQSIANFMSNDTDMTTDDFATFDISPDCPQDGPFDIAFLKVFAIMRQFVPGESDRNIGTLFLQVQERVSPDVGIRCQTLAVPFRSTEAVASASNDLVLYSTLTRVALAHGQSSYFLSAVASQSEPAGASEAQISINQLTNHDVVPWEDRQFVFMEIGRTFDSSIFALDPSILEGVPRPITQQQWELLLFAFDRSPSAEAVSASSYRNSITDAPFLARCAFRKGVRGVQNNPPVVFPATNYVLGEGDCAVVNLSNGAFDQDNEVFYTSTPNLNVRYSILGNPPNIAFYTGTGCNPSNAIPLDGSIVHIAFGGPISFEYTGACSVIETRSFDYLTWNYEGSSGSFFPNSTVETSDITIFCL